MFDVEQKREVAQLLHRSEEHTSELQSLAYLVCRLLLEKKKEIRLAACAFLLGQIEIRRIALVGVQLTLVRTKEGALRLGVERSETSEDVLHRIRDAIQQ